jgi:hypothetical protein
LLIAGTALNGLMSLPTAVQLAYGWTSLAIATNLVAVAALVPMMFVLTYRFGAAGGAAAWVLLNSAYVLLALPLMHRRILRGEQWRWYGIDVGLPFVAALAVAVGCRWLFDSLQAQALSRLGVLACLALTGLATAAAAALAAPVVRVRLASAFSGSDKRGV